MASSRDFDDRKEERKEDSVSIKSNPPSDETAPNQDEAAKPAEESPSLIPDKPHTEDKVATELKSGDIVGVYRIEKMIGRGGMAVVFRAFDTSKQRVVALKVLKRKLSTSSKALARFDREFLALESLNHSNVVRVLDKGEAGGFNYFVMEYIDGASFSRLLKHGKLTFNTKAQILLQIAGALDYAHKRGIVHRDVKPDNVLIDRTGRAKMADFGIAQMTRSSLPFSSITVTSSYMGTADYMAPEQRVDAKSVDPRADIYSFGVMAYETFTGKLPFGNFPLPSQVNPELSKRMDGIILKALRPDPAERYQSILELAEDLKQEIRPSALSRIYARLSLILQTESWRKVFNTRTAASIAIIAIAGAGVYGLFSAIGKPLPESSTKPTEAEQPASLASPAEPTGPLSNMTLVPAGEFIMGSDSEFANERPKRSVFLKAFYIDTFEVTNVEYKKFVDATGRPVPYQNAFWAEPFNWRNGTYPPDRADHPVVLVSWSDAAAYAKWAGKRLPTEAEWEKAARGTEGNIWPWGNKWDIHNCNIRESFINTTQPVYLFASGKSPYGCYNMAGNAMEWTNDWYAENYYSHDAPQKNPPGPPAGTYKVARGGAWDSNINLYVRSGYRHYFPPTDKKASIGFRCARDAETKQQ